MSAQDACRIGFLRIGGLSGLPWTPEPLWAPLASNPWLPGLPWACLGLLGSP